MYLNKNAWGQLQETLTANEQELQLLRNNAEQFRAGFAAKDRIIRQLQANHQQSTEKDCVTHHLKSDIQQLQTMINKKDSALGHLQADVLSKDRTIQQLQSNPAAMRDSTGEHVHLGIKQLQLAISGKDRKLERLNSIVQNQDMQLQRQKHDINMKDKKLKDRNIQVQQLDDDLWHTSRALADLQIEYDKCSSDEELLQERSSLLADRAQLYEAQATIAELEEQYSEQRAELLRVDSVVDSLTTDVEYYEERIRYVLSVVHGCLVYAQLQVYAHLEQS